MLDKPIPRSKNIGIIGLVILFILGVFLLPMARAGTQKVPAEIAKDIEEIEMIKLEIESLQRTIQMKLEGLRKKEAKLGLMLDRLSAKQPLNQQPSGGGGMMMGARVMPKEPVFKQDSLLDEGALPENISDEVRKELQRILPGLLREMLPQLLKEAKIKTVESPSL